LEWTDVSYTVLLLRKSIPCRCITHSIPSYSVCSKSLSLLLINLYVTWNFNPFHLLGFRSDVRLLSLSLIVGQRLRANRVQPPEPVWSSSFRSRALRPPLHAVLLLLPAQARSPVRRRAAPVPGPRFPGTPPLAARSRPRDTFLPQVSRFPSRAGPHTAIRSVRSSFAAYLWFVSADLTAVVDGLSPVTILSCLQKGVSSLPHRSRVRLPARRQFPTPLTLLLARPQR
jgi:hypothetical protein